DGRVPGCRAHRGARPRRDEHVRPARGALAGDRPGGPRGPGRGRCGQGHLRPVADLQGGGGRPHRAAASRDPARVGPPGATAAHGQELGRPRVVPVRIATWNVNSIRARVDRVTAFLERHDVDVLAFQETKCRDDQFPYMPFEAAGYEVADVGLNQWNGVAIASRVGLEDFEVGFDGMPGCGAPADSEARVISDVCSGVRVTSLYVPNGRTLDDPPMAYKLDWLDRLSDS